MGVERGGYCVEIARLSGKNLHIFAGHWMLRSLSPDQLSTQKSCLIPPAQCRDLHLPLATTSPLYYGICMVRNLLHKMFSAGFMLPATTSSAHNRYTRCPARCPPCPFFFICPACAMRGESGILTQLRPHQQRRPHRDGARNS